MTDFREQYKQRVKEHTIKESICLEDGYRVWWPDKVGGYLNSDTLRLMADTLDELNKEWNDQVEKDVGQL